MLFDLTVKIIVSGRSADDALARLRAKIPHWEIEVIETSPSKNQPAPITGTANITLPLNFVHGY